MSSKTYRLLDGLDADEMEAYDLIRDAAIDPVRASDLWDGKTALPPPVRQHLEDITSPDDDDLEEFFEET